MAGCPMPGQQSPAVGGESTHREDNPHPVHNKGAIHGPRLPRNGLPGSWGLVSLLQDGRRHQSHGLVLSLAKFRRCHLPHHFTSKKVSDAHVLQKTI